MLNENMDCKGLDVRAIERAAKEGMLHGSKATGGADIVRDVARAIAAAIEEYDRQKSK